MLDKKKILLGVTGSIAAYKAPMIVRELIKSGAEVRVIMTPSAREFVSPLVLSNLSRSPVVIDMFSEAMQTEGAWHIHLAHWCDAMLIAPCSATSLGRLANGIFDTALSAVAAALPEKTPLLLAPAMDTEMWLHKSTQRNVDFLKSICAEIIPPEEGELSSGLSGPGRLPEIPVLLEALANALKSAKNPITPDSDNIKPETIADSKVRIDNSKADNAIPIEFVKTEQSYEEKLNIALSKPDESLQASVEKDKWNAEMELSELKKKHSGNEISGKFLLGKKVLITAGPTYEKIDDVRFIGNFSTGKMGFALAIEAAKAGAEVTLVAGPVSLDTPENVKRINVVSAKEMEEQTNHHFHNNDIIIMSAAVADFTPKQRFDGKIKKSAEKMDLALELTPTNDILKGLGKVKRENQILIGFALESQNEIENAKRKLIEKNCDMLALNSAVKPNSGFGGDNNTIALIFPDGQIESYPPMSKRACAEIIIRKTSQIKK